MIAIPLFQPFSYITSAHISEYISEYDKNNGISYRISHAFKYWKLDWIKDIFNSQNSTIVLKDHTEKITLHIAVKESIFNNARNRSGDRIIRFLINQGLDINARDAWDYTPLHIACEVNNYDIIKFLTSQKADINTLNKNQETPLYTSLLLHNDAYISKYLISKSGLIHPGPLFKEDGPLYKIIEALYKDINSKMYLAHNIQIIKDIVTYSSADYHDTLLIINKIKSIITDKLSYKNGYKDKIIYKIKEMLDTYENTAKSVFKHLYDNDMSVDEIIEENQKIFDTTYKNSFNLNHAIWAIFTLGDGKKKKHLLNKEDLHTFINQKIKIFDSSNCIIDSCFSQEYDPYISFTATEWSFFQRHKFLKYLRSPLYTKRLEKYVEYKENKAKYSILNYSKKHQFKNIEKIALYYNIAHQCVQNSKTQKPSLSDISIEFSKKS
jgi:ankyrin repeat protein